MQIQKNLCGRPSAKVGANGQGSCQRPLERSPVIWKDFPRRTCSGVPLSGLWGHLTLRLRLRFLPHGGLQRVLAVCLRRNLKWMFKSTLQGNCRRPLVGSQATLKRFFPPSFSRSPFARALGVTGTETEVCSARQRKLFAVCFRRNLKLNFKWLFAMQLAATFGKVSR